jgi:predicted AAA+ superfamily ATPase
MKRKALGHLLAWKNSPGRKPLLLKGARQVGKTWLMKEFGELAYRNTVYIDFFNNLEARKVFDGDLKPRRIIEELGFIMGASIDPNETLVIFDEVQECNRGLNSLKYFCEEAPEYHIIAAGSFLGIALHQDESFPVGKTDSFTLFPMTFSEFLNALEEKQLLAAIEKRQPRLVNLVKNNLTKYLKYYFYTGGMPEVVHSFVKEKNFKQIRLLQKRIISDYEDDFSKHTGMGAAEKLLRLWNSIPGQLAREKKKFVYNDLKPGAKSRDYRSSLFWLARCGLVYEVNRVSLPHYPLVSYAENDHFKLYMLDLGLLSAMASLDIDAFLDRDSAFFDHFHGALAEQYVLQELKALEDIPVFYWTREGSAKAEVDFVIQTGNKVIPLEVKAEKNLKAKSLKVFASLYKPQIAIRSSLADLGQHTWENGITYDIPLYMIGGIIPALADNPIIAIQ